MALLPFKTVSMRVLQCSFLSGIQTHKIFPLLRMLQPKLVLFPEDLRPLCTRQDSISFSLLFYSVNSTLRVPTPHDDFEGRVRTDLTFQLQPRRLSSKEMALARLRGKLVLSKGKYLLESFWPPTSRPETERKSHLDSSGASWQRLEMEKFGFHEMGLHSCIPISRQYSETRLLGEFMPNEPLVSPKMPISLPNLGILLWGSVDPARLLVALKEKGIDCSIEKNEITVSDSDAHSVRIRVSEKAMIETDRTKTTICTENATMAALIHQTLSSICDGI